MPRRVPRTRDLEATICWQQIQADKAARDQ
jgi:hypothetical protein